MYIATNWRKKVIFASSSKKTLEKWAKKYRFGSKLTITPNWNGLEGLFREIYGDSLQQVITDYVTAYGQIFLPESKSSGNLYNQPTIIPTPNNPSIRKKKK